MPALEALTINLLAAALSSGATVGRSKLDDRLRSDRFSPDVDDLATEFNEALQEAIADVADERDDEYLVAIADNWDDIAEELDAVDIYADDPESAHRRIAETIVELHSVDPAANRTLEHMLQGILSDVYQDIIADFEQRVAGTGRADRLGFENDRKLRHQLNEVIARLGGPRFYKSFNADVEGIEDAIERLQLPDRSDTREGKRHLIDFVSRPELPDELSDPEKLVLIGPGGSGKTRALAELLSGLNTECVETIVVPEIMTTVGDINQLLAEPFEGDVLLVWDDIHDIRPEAENAIFGETVTRLERTLREDDHSLHVLATARTENLDTLPGKFGSEDDTLWQGFETIELAAFDAESLSTLFRRSLNERDIGIEVSEKVSNAFGQMAVQNYPHPFYVTSIVMNIDRDMKELTIENIEEFPDEPREIWENAYQTLTTDNNSGRFLLNALKILSGFRIPLYRPLVRGVYENVIDPPEPFTRTLDSSLEERGWIGIEQDEAVSLDRYRVHDIQIEAINEPVEDWLNGLSDFLLQGPLHRYLRHLPTEMDEFESRLHAQFGVLLFDQYTDKYTSEAVDHLEKALELDPDFAEAHHVYAVFLYKLDELESEEAANHFNRALELKPNDADIRNSYANYFSESGSAEETATHYERALEIDPDHTEAHYNYARLLFRELDEPEEAATLLERALELGLDNARAHYSYANLLSSELDEPKEAVTHFERALEIDPNDADTHYNYAILLSSELDEPEEAATHFERALEIDPDLTEAHHAYGRLLWVLGEPEKAATHFERVPEIDPDDVWTYKNYARLLWELDEPEEAATHYERALEIDPDDAWTHNDYANLLGNELDEPEEAATHFERALEIDPDLTEAYHAYAILLADDSNRSEEAATHYERALEINPDDAWTHNDYANLLADGLDEPEEAATHYERALEIDPDHARAHYNYASLLGSELDEPEEAAIHYERALEIDPDDADTHYNYAILLSSELDDLELAQYHVKQSVKLSITEGNINNALDDIKTLIQICEERGAADTAIEWCERALAIISNTDSAKINGSNSFDAERRYRQFRLRYAQLSGRDPAKSVLECYFHALEYVLKNEGDTALALFEHAWDHRENLDPETDAYRMAVAAGVGVAVLLTLVNDADAADGQDKVVTEIKPEKHQLTSSPSVAFEYLTTGETDAMPEDLLDSLPENLHEEEPSVNHLEPLAFASLLSMLQTAP